MRGTRVDRSSRSSRYVIWRRLSMIATRSGDLVGRQLEEVRESCSAAFGHAVESRTRFTWFWANGPGGWTFHRRYVIRLCGLPSAPTATTRTFDGTIISGAPRFAPPPSASPASVETVADAVGPEGVDGDDSDDDVGEDETMQQRARRDCSRSVCRRASWGLRRGRRWSSNPAGNQGGCRRPPHRGVRTRPATAPAAIIAQSQRRSDRNRRRAAPPRAASSPSTQASSRRAAASRSSSTAIGRVDTADPAVQRREPHLHENAGDAHLPRSVGACRRPCTARVMIAVISSVTRRHDVGVLDCAEPNARTIAAVTSG